MLKEYRKLQSVFAFRGLTVLALVLSVCGYNSHLFADSLIRSSDRDKIGIETGEGSEKPSIVRIPLLQNKFNSGSIEPMSKDQIILIREKIEMLHKNGKNVILIPEIILIDNQDGAYSNSDIGFSDETKWEEWFGSYKESILFWSKTAQEMNVEIFCAGSGLSLTLSRCDLWEEVLASVRQNYKGEIIFFVDVDCVNQIHFLEKLDMMGVNFTSFVSSCGPKTDISFLKDQIRQWFFDLHKLSALTIMFI